jgi:hypothetical protein
VHISLDRIPRNTPSLTASNRAAIVSPPPNRPRTPGDVQATSTRSPIKPESAQICLLPAHCTSPVHRLQPWLDPRRMGWPAACIKGFLADINSRIRIAADLSAKQTPPRRRSRQADVRSTHATPGKQTQNRCAGGSLQGWRGADGILSPLRLPITPCPPCPRKGFQGFG